MKESHSISVSNIVNNRSSSPGRKGCFSAALISSHTSSGGEQFRVLLSHLTKLHLALHSRTCNDPTFVSQVLCLAMCSLSFFLLEFLVMYQGHLQSAVHLSRSLFLSLLLLSLLLSFSLCGLG